MIKILEIELINKCQLSCPLCTRNQKKFKELDMYRNPDEIDFTQLIDFLDNLDDLEKVLLVGSVSEPTLYSHFLDLVKYLKNRNISITISTNGMSNINWDKLNKLLNKNDIIKWAIDGSTQELHSFYRKGSVLDTVLKHKNKVFGAYNVLQNIIFKHNESDIENIKNLGKEFDEVSFEHCYSFSDENYISKPVYEPIELIQKVYINIKPHNNIMCESKKYNSWYISFTGDLFPCCHLNEANFKTECNIKNEFVDIKKYLDTLVSKTDENICKIMCSKVNQNIFKHFNIDP